MHAAIEIRLSTILKTGLSKETQKELYEKYPPPINCKMLKAPILNGEIVTGVSSYSNLRNNYQMVAQNFTGAETAAVGKALTNLLNVSNKPG